jgi:hypothetical protein
MACMFWGLPNSFTRGEGSCRGDYSCEKGEYEEVCWELERKSYEAKHFSKYHTDLSSLLH